MDFGDPRLPADFWIRVKRPANDNDCWQWVGQTIEGGWGRFRLKGVGRVVAHRLVYSVGQGLPLGLEPIRHTCGFRACVNPDHLQHRDHPTTEVIGGVAYVAVCDKYDDYVAKIDEGDLALVEPYRWRPLKQDDAGRRIYAVTKSHRQVILMHRLLCPGDADVDHINHDGLDNRRANLRLATPSENGGNARLSRISTTGYKGVCFDKRRIGWQASIRIEYKRKHLGLFSSIIDAALAYDRAARLYFGPYAFTNYPVFAAGESGPMDDS